MKTRSLRLLIASVSAAALLGGAAGTAVARHGADDPAGHQRREDRAGERRHRADDAAGHHRREDRRRARAARHGGDDPAGDDRGRHGGDDRSDDD